MTDRAQRLQALLEALRRPRLSPEDREALAALVRRDLATLEARQGGAAKARARLARQVHDGIVLAAGAFPDLADPLTARATLKRIEMRGCEAYGLPFMPAIATISDALVSEARDRAASARYAVSLTSSST